MNIGSMLAIYFIIWWICLFLVLPFGIQSSHEAGVDVEEGHERGAPILAGMWKKVAVNTVLATAVFACLYAAYANGLLNFTPQGR